MADLSMLMTKTPQGPYPYAGIPWYSTTFGRDGMITALQMLWLDPRIARGVLNRLAALPGARTTDRGIGRRAGQDPARDARRRDGRAGRGSVPPLLRHRRLDAAVRAARRPLRGAHRRLRDPASAVAGDRSGAGLDRRAGRSRSATASSSTTARPSKGLANQGWKDSFDCDLSCRRPAGGRADRRSPKCRATCMRRKAAGRALRPHLGHARACARSWTSRRTGSRERFERGVLVPGDRHVCARARRRQAAVPGAHLECRPGPVHRHRRPERARQIGARADRTGLLHRLGHSHRVAPRGALQPDVVSQRLDLAARQRPDRARASAVTG